MFQLFVDIFAPLNLFLQGRISYNSAKTIAALIFFLPGFVSIIAPEFARNKVRNFPRDILAGRILSTIALAWSALLIYIMPLDFLAKLKGPLFILLLFFIPLSWKWMTDLLAVRSLAGLMCLLPAPILLASRFATGDTRLVIVSLMYILAVIGMICCFSPFYLRDAIVWYSGGGNNRIRVIGCILLVVSILSITS